MPDGMNLENPIKRTPRSRCDELEIVDLTVLRAKKKSDFSMFHRRVALIKGRHLAEIGSHGF